MIDLFVDMSNAIMKRPVAANFANRFLGEFAVMDLSAVIIKIRKQLIAANFANRFLGGGPDVFV